MTKEEPKVPRLETILAESFRLRGHPHPVMEAQLVLFWLARAAPGEQVRIPAATVSRRERNRRIREAQGAPVESLAARFECAKSTVYRALEKQSHDCTQLATIPEDDPTPKKG